jgi:SAM-dependent methyltransferase
MLDRPALIIGELLAPTNPVRAVRAAEIGPLNRPLLGKTAVGPGGVVFYVDHCDTDTLRAKWANDPSVDTAVLHVDAVWGDVDLRGAIDRSALAVDQGLIGAPLDFVVASHVIEHVPDVVSWLQEIAHVLRPDGRLRLAVPDKRFTFDLLRQPSSLAQVCEAYVCRWRRPSPGQILDFAINEVVVDQQQAWRGEVDRAALRHPHTLAGAMAVARDSADNGTYHDVHCWVFTPDSFAALFEALAREGLVPFACERLIDTPEPELEFYAWLRRCDDAQEAAASWQQRITELAARREALAARAEPPPTSAEDALEPGRQAREEALR